MPLTEEAVRKRLLERVYFLVEDISKKLVFYIIHLLCEEEQIRVFEILQQAQVLIHSRENPKTTPQEVSVFKGALYIIACDS